MRNLFGKAAEKGKEIIQKAPKPNIDIRKYKINPSVIPAAAVFVLALAGGARNLILRNRRSETAFFLDNETGFLGGGEEMLEENYLLNGVVLAASESAASSFSAASLSNPLNAFVSNQAEDSSVESEETTNSLSAASLVNPMNPAYEEPEEHRGEIVKYTVKQGDTASSIANQFGISTNTILWANNLHSSSIIKPGNTLEILPISGVKHASSAGDTLEAIAKKYEASEEEIAYYNGLSLSGSLLANTTVIVPGGALPDSMRAKPKTIAAAKKAPTYATAGVSSGYFIYPAAGHNWGRIHASNGIDISNAKGGPIYAAASGKIILADGSGYNGGYGKYIKIQHPNGVVTLYGHLSKIYVSNGQSVEQGAVIGMMGNTGRSTGTHLHFEVRGAKNPLARY